jgi:hypothetical protein
MIVTNEPGDDIPEKIPETPEVLSALPAASAETPVTTPKDDPEKIITSLQDYDNSLNALLKNNDT